MQSIFTKSSIAPAARSKNNFIKLHKTQLASDRTSCRDPLRQPVPPHSAHVRLLAPARHAQCRAGPAFRSYWQPGEFAMLRLRLLKIAARVVEGVARIRLFLPSACPERRRLPSPCRTLLRRGTLSAAALSPRRARPATLNRYTIRTEISVPTDATARHDHM